MPPLPPTTIPLDLAVPAVVAVCIVGVLYWLWKRYRVRRPKQKPSGEGK